MRRAVLAAGLLVAMACGLMLVSGWAMMRRAPAWWRTVRRDPATVRAAERLQDAIATQLHLIRGGGGDGAGEVWAVSLRAADANAWLNTSLPRWLAHEHESFRWPQELAEVQVEFDDGLVRVGARVDLPGGSRIFSATLRPVLSGDGALWMAASWVRIGRLAIPASWVIDRARAGRERFVPEEVRDLPETVLMFDAFAGRVPVAREAVVRLGDGRRVRLLGLRARDGRLEVTCRTEPPPREVSESRAAPPAGLSPGEPPAYSWPR